MNTIYNDEKLLLECDAHALEEKRYLDRLRKSELKQKPIYRKHYETIVLPKIKD